MAGQCDLIGALLIRPAVPMSTLVGASHQAVSCFARFTKKARCEKLLNKADTDSLYNFRVARISAHACLLFQTTRCSFGHYSSTANIHACTRLTHCREPGITVSFMTRDEDPIPIASYSIFKAKPKCSVCAHAHEIKIIVFTRQHPSRRRQHPPRLRPPRSFPQEPRTGAG